MDNNQKPVNPLGLKP